MGNDVRKGKGYGFTTDDGKIYLIRCFKCGKENWAPAVASGQCAFCGYDANAKAAKPRKKGKSVSKLKGSVNLLILQDKLKANLRKRR